MKTPANWRSMSAKEKVKWIDEQEEKDEQKRIRIREREGS